MHKINRERIWKVDEVLDKIDYEGGLYEAYRWGIATVKTDNAEFNKLLVEGEAIARNLESISLRLIRIERKENELREL
jgi:hypothetical protein